MEQGSKGANNCLPEAKCGSDETNGDEGQEKKPLSQSPGAADGPENASPPEQKAPHPHRDWHDKGMLILLFLGFLAAVAAASFAYRQGNIAAESLDLSKKTAIAQIRAYVFVKPYGWVNGVMPNQHFNTTIGIRNGGQTPANDMILRLEFAVRKSPPENSHQSFLATPFHPIETVLDSSANAVGVGQINSRSILSIKDIEAVSQQGMANIYVWGAVQYKDVFERQHHSFFCFVYFGREENRDDGGLGSRYQGTCPHPNPD